MTSRTKILQCAERIAVRDGVARLTLDAVAAEANLSKGGLLYNFRTKEDLVRGMIDRLTDEFETAMERCLAADPNPVGRFTRAYLDVSFPGPATEEERRNRVAGALLAAIFNNPDLLGPVRERVQQHLDRLMQDGLDPVKVNLIRLAADGLWMADILSMPGPDPELRNTLLRTLYEMTRS